MKLSIGVARFGLLLLIGMMLFLNQPQPLAGAQVATVPPTNTPRGKAQTATRTPTLTRTPTRTRTPTNTRTPTPTRTPTVTPTPVPTMVILGTYTTPVVPPLTAITPAAPSPMPSGDDVVTVLLLGSDTVSHTSASRTDVIMLLSIDRTAQTVTMLHIPRDLYVYVPNYTMVKINTVVNYGNTTFGPGGGAKLMKDTILYNLGIKVNFYARVDFAQFEDLIAKLGGLDISVDCAIQGYRLKSPDLDYTKEENYELYTLPVGQHHLNPYMALWYVRSRGSSSDFDRGRRQMDVLRAMWRQAKEAGLFAQVATLWPEVQKSVETDMTLSDILGLVPVGLAVDPAHIQRIELTLGVHAKAITLDSYALIPIQSAWRAAIQDFVLPPPETRLGGESPIVEVGAALPLKGYDQVAADRLSWEGFTARVVTNENVVNRDATVIYDYTGNAKPASLQSMMKILRVDKSAVIQKPDPNRTVDFRVEMGRSYGTCLLALPKDALTLTPEPG